MSVARPAQSSLTLPVRVQRKPAGPTTARKPVPKPVNLPSQHKVCSLWFVRRLSGVIVRVRTSAAAQERRVVAAP